MSTIKYLYKFITIFFGMLLLYWCFSDFSSFSLRPATSNSWNSPENGTGVVTCQFPAFDPFHPYAMKHYTKYPTMTCRGMTTLTYYDGEAVRVNPTLKELKHGKKDIRCWYRELTYRRNFLFVNGEWHGPFVDALKVKERPEYVEVECKTKKGETVSQMHHYITREELRKRSVPRKKDHFTADQLNVLLLGVDSLSSYLFKRAMPLTRKYLLHDLNALELNKYNKVGDNTFPNLLAILTGLFEQDLSNWKISHGFDNLPFVWNLYKSAGYRTQYTSDRFDFNDFQTPPTDSYSLPMLSALMVGKTDFDNDCYNDKVEIKLWLDQIVEFAKDSLFTTGRFFSMAMFKRPTHDFPNKASAVDEYYVKFLKKMHQNNILNNTFLVFFGDHGLRVSSYRRTLLGSIEERAANMVIYTPPWFKHKYPIHYNSLKINQERLTTNFDIHETLKSLLVLSDKTPKREGNSNNNNNNNRIIQSANGMTRALNLFTEISPKRTCEDADIDPHFCLCYGGVSVVDSKIMKEVGDHVVKHINTLLRPVSSLCATLRLKGVKSLSLLQGYVGWTATYRVMLSTTPGGAELEATVKYNLKALFFTSMEMLGFISRINMYRGQSDCINSDKQLRMYCYCRNLLTDPNDKRRRLS